MLNIISIKNFIEEKLFALILHELHHILLGHTRLYKRVTPQHNLAFDAIINAMLSRMNPEPSWTALFREYYKPNVFPFYFLRPPVGFPDTPVYPELMPEQHRQILYQLYYKNGGSFHEIFLFSIFFSCFRGRNKWSAQIIG